MQTDAYAAKPMTTTHGPRIRKKGKRKGDKTGGGGAWRAYISEQRRGAKGASRIPLKQFARQYHIISAAGGVQWEDLVRKGKAGTVSHSVRGTAFGFWIGKNGRTFRKRPRRCCSLSKGIAAQPQESPAVSELALNALALAKPALLSLCDQRRCGARAVAVAAANGNVQ